MQNLTDEMKDLLKNNLCYIATASPDGMPCVAPKTCRFTDEGGLYYIEWAGRKTYENLKANPRISISTCSQDKKISYRFEGKAEVWLNKTPFPAVPPDSRRRASGPDGGDFECRRGPPGARTGKPGPTPSSA